jgi:hypothetical protein
MWKLLVVFSACTLVACSAAGRKLLPPAQRSYGSFLTSTLDPAPLAAASVKMLASKFPPAQTRITLDPPPSDAFGMALVNRLRETGYAVLEPAPGGKSAADGSLMLRYVVDQQGTTQEDTTYRVLLQVGNETLARLYTERNGQFEPISNWVRGESRR